jgi:hypothetical protein
MIQSRPVPGRRKEDATTRYVRHLEAVSRSLAMADASAERGDFADALAWVRTVEAIGDPLPDPYRRKRQAWRAALRGRGRAGGASAA